MKKTVLLICASLMIGASLFAQDVPEVQKTLVTKITATWCPNCGTWGWDYFEHVIEDNNDKAIFVGAHHDGDLESAAGIAFKDNFNAPYQPFFYAGNKDLNVTNNNTVAKRTEMQDIINANAANAPVANVGFSASLTNGFLTVDTKTKFFQEATGDYYLGLYILEDGVINNQASNSAMSSHPFVIRTAITNDIFGDALMNGTIAADTEYDGSFSLQLNPNWTEENVIVAGIIWEKDNDGVYQFVNINSTNDFTATTAVTSISQDVLNVQLYPTIAEESTRLDLNLKPSSLQVNIQLFNQTGQKVQEIFQGTLREGNRSLNIETNRLDAGIYFVNIRTADGAILTKKFIVQ